MISSIRLQNFKGHRDTTVELGRFTVLVGPNGSGKTSVLEALWLQSRLVRDSPSNIFRDDWSPNDLLRRGAQEPISLTLRGESLNTPWEVKVDIITHQSIETAWQLKSHLKHGQTSTAGQGNNPPLKNFISQLDEAVGSAALYNLDARKISNSAYSDHTRPEIEPDGTNTAVVLAALKLDQDEEFERIEAELHRLIPNVERVRIKRASVLTTRGNVVGSKIYFDFKGATGVPAHAASEGTLVSLALLTVLHGPTRPKLILLDDFDHALHPQAQLELVRLLKQLLDEFPEIQIVATTHSPYILDELDPANVYVFALRNDGSVATKRLSEHPDAERMRGTLSAGELWSLDPEKDWVAQEKAS